MNIPFSTACQKGGALGKLIQHGHRYTALARRRSGLCFEFSNRDFHRIGDVGRIVAHLNVDFIMHGVFLRMRILRPQQRHGDGKAQYCRKKGSPHGSLPSTDILQLGHNLAANDGRTGRFEEA